MRRDTLLRRATIWLATIGYALVVSGLPLPLGGMQPVSPTPAAAKSLAGKDRSRPFPCMDKPCGCTTAEQCFSNCCCNTPAERLAWAKAHSVEAAVLVALERRVALETAVSEPSGGGCCGKKSAPACCTTLTADVDGPEVCSEYRPLATTAAPAAEPAPVTEPEPTESLQPRMVVLRAMLACGGIVAQWFSCGVSLPPPPPPAAVTLHKPRIDIAIVADIVLLSGRTAPDLPPPRV